MNNSNETKFKIALKTIVIEEPQKLAFFDGLEKDRDILPFIHEDEDVPKPNAGYKRRRIHTVPSKLKYSLAMTAAVACSVVFLSLAVINSKPEMSIRLGQIVEQSADVMSADAIPAEAQPHEGNHLDNVMPLEEAPLPESTDAAPDESLSPLMAEPQTTPTNPDREIPAIIFLLCAFGCAILFALLFVKRKNLR